MSDSYPLSESINCFERGSDPVPESTIRPCWFGVNRVLSLNARATGDGPLPRAFHSPANPRAQSPGAVSPGLPLRERRQAARDLGVLAQAMATANVQETGRAAMNATVAGLFARLTNRPAQLSPRKGKQALT